MVSLASPSPFRLCLRFGVRRLPLGFAAFTLIFAPALSAATPTPDHFPDAETHIYRADPSEPVRLHIVKPQDWTAHDHRPALIWFFGGGFVRGTPQQSIGWARRAAQLGLVGIAPDYRVAERWPDADARLTVADARAALRWVQEHATELGVDPLNIVVGGASAGGHLALWTAIPTTPLGLDSADAPLAPPSALLLTNPPSNTARSSGLPVERFGGIDPGEYSPLQHLPPAMPPVFLIHGDADTVVPYAQSVALHDTLIAAGQICEFITVPGGGHKFSSDLPAWREKLPLLHVDFLTRLGILPVKSSP